MAWARNALCETVSSTRHRQRPDWPTVTGQNSASDLTCDLVAYVHHLSSGNVSKKGRNSLHLNAELTACGHRLAMLPMEGKTKDKASEATALIAASTSSQPMYLGSSTERWVSLSIVTLGISFGLVPTNSWQVLQQMMLNDGIFQCEVVDGLASRNDAVLTLNTIGSLVTGLNLCSGFFVGHIFDTVGPRILTATSAIISTVCFVMMGLACQFPCTMSFGLSFAIILSAGAQSWAGYAYLWLMPEHTFVVSAVGQVAYCLASAYATAAADLNQASSNGVTAYGLYYALAVATGLSTFSCIYLVPSKAEFEELQSRVLKDASRDGSPEAMPQVRNCWDQLVDRFRDVHVLLFSSKVFGWPGFFVFMHMASVYMAQFVIGNEQVTLAHARLPNEAISPYQTGCPRPVVRCSCTSACASPVHRSTNIISPSSPQIGPPISSMKPGGLLLSLGFLLPWPLASLHSGCHLSTRY